MKKRLLFQITGLLVICAFSVFTVVGEKTDKTHAADTSEVTLTGNVLQYLALSISSGGTIAFGNITPGVPVCDINGTVVSVTTSASNGYTLSVSDGSDTDSAMTHTDTTTKIPDMAGTVASPVAWSDGVTTGLGISLFAADTSKEAKWGDGLSACATGNKWAGVPASATVGHTSAGFHVGADTTSWGWKIDVPNTQKTGDYSGSVLFTSTASLS